MGRILMRRTAKRLAVFGLGLVVASSSAGWDDGFTPLLQGGDLSALELVGIGPETVSVSKGEIRLAGQRKGYVGTRTSYKNYSLRFDWRYERPKDYQEGKPFYGNSGLIVHIQGPSQVWPRCIEVQVWHKKEYGTFYTLGGGKFSPQRDDHEKLGRVLNPVGEWNRHEITSRDGTITVAVNDTPIASGKNADPDQGRIGWMSEDLPIHFRNLRIQPP
jgi:hypothetical protein